MNSRIYLSSVALLCMVSGFGQAPSPGEQRTFYRETRNSNSTLILYGKGTYSFFKETGGRSRFDSGYYKVSRRIGKLKLHSTERQKQYNFDGPFTETVYLTHQGIRREDKHGRIYMYDADYKNGVSSKINVVTVSLDTGNMHYQMIANNLPDSRTQGARAADSMLASQNKIRRIDRFRDKNKDLYLRKLADSFCFGIRNDSLKLVAICNWMLNRLSYDYTFSKPTEAYEAVINGSTVCMGYANILTELCTGAGVACIPVIGDVTYLKNKLDFRYERQHAWNMVKLNNNWYTLDVTWMDGDNIVNVNQDLKWYLTTPDIFSNTHYPNNAALTFRSDMGNSLKEYNYNPIVFNQTRHLRLISPQSNIVFPDTDQKTSAILLYADRPDTLKVNINDNLNQIIMLQSGVNRIALAGSEKISHYVFDNAHFKMEFLAATGIDRREMWRYYSQKHSYYFDKLFYQYLNQLLDGKSFNFNESVPAALRDSSIWRKMLLSYDGRILPAVHMQQISLKYNEDSKEYERNKKHTFRYEFPDLQIAGATPYLYFPLILSDNKDRFTIADPVQTGIPFWGFEKSPAALLVRR